MSFTVTWASLHCLPGDFSRSKSPNQRQNLGVYKLRPVGREPVHSESNMMKLIILTLAAATLVLGAPHAPLAPVADETSAPRRPQSEVSKHQIESMIEESSDYHELRSHKESVINKRSVEEDFETVAGLFFLEISKTFRYILFIQCQQGDMRRTRILLRLKRGGSRPSRWKRVCMLKTSPAPKFPLTQDNSNFNP